MKNYVIIDNNWLLYNKVITYTIILEILCEVDGLGIVMP